MWSKCRLKTNANFVAEFFLTDTLENAKDAGDSTAEIA